MSSILWKNVNLVDVKEKKIVENVDVLAVDGVITEVGAGLAAEADEIIDGSGKYMTPGIIDTHVHITWDGTANPVGLDEHEGVFQAFLRGIKHAGQCLKAGVTTVREVGSKQDVAIEVAYSINKGYAPGCTIYPVGSAIQSVYGHVPAVGTIADSDGEIMTAIREKKIKLTEKEIPCQWIKIMATGGAAGMEEDITDPCLGWEKTERLILDIADSL